MTSRQRNVYIIFCLISILIIIIGSVHLYVQTSPSYGPRVIRGIKIEGGKAIDLPPKKFGVSSAELNKYLIIENESIYNRPWLEDELIEASNKCFDELGIRDQALKDGFSPFIILNAANPIISYLIIIIGFLLFIIFTINSWKERWFEEFRRTNAPYLFISPFYILFFIFSAFPLAFSAYVSVHNWIHVCPESVPYVGLKNYIYLFTNDPYFLLSLKNTIILLFMGTMPQHLIALPLAFIINSGLVKLKNFFRATLFLPYITSTVIIGLVFSVVYGYQYGLLNFIIKTLSQHGFGGIFNFLHIEPTGWTARAHTIQPAISFLLIWRWTGWNMILYLAGLQAIPKELYEAAKVDGANMRQVFFRITLPLLKPMILFAVTLSIIGGMQLFDEAFILTAGGQAVQLGGTMNKGLTTALYLYTTGFIWTKISVGCAMSWVLFVIIMTMSLLNFKLFRRGEM